MTNSLRQSFQEGSPVSSGQGREKGSEAIGPELQALWNAIEGWIQGLHDLCRAAKSFHAAQGVFKCEMVVVQSLRSTVVHQGYTGIAEPLTPLGIFPTVEVDVGAEGVFDRYFTRKTTVTRVGVQVLPC